MCICFVINFLIDCRSQHTYLAVGIVVAVLVDEVIAPIVYFEHLGVHPIVTK